MITTKIFAGFTILFLLIIAFNVFLRGSQTNSTFNDGDYFIYQQIKGEKKDTRVKYTIEESKKGSYLLVWGTQDINANSETHLQDAKSVIFNRDGKITGVPTNLDENLKEHYYGKQIKLFLPAHLREVGKKVFFNEPATESSVIEFRSLKKVGAFVVKSTDKNAIYDVNNNFWVEYYFDLKTGFLVAQVDSLGNTFELIETNIEGLVVRGK